jgi:hypothetical protein
MDSSSSSSKKSAKNEGNSLVSSDQSEKSDESDLELFVMDGLQLSGKQEHFKIINNH